MTASPAGEGRPRQRGESCDAGTTAPPPPASVRGAGLIIAVQGMAGLATAAVLVWRGFGGADQQVVNGYGTAIWFALVGVGVLAAGCALVAGRRWGRGLGVFVQLLLLPVAWYLTVDSHRPEFGIPVGSVALVVLALLFGPAALRWAARTDHSGSAGSAGAGPHLPG